MVKEAASVPPRRVGQGIAVVVVGCHWITDVLSRGRIRGCVLVHAAAARLGGREHRRIVHVGEGDGHGDGGVNGGVARVVGGLPVMDRHGDAVGVLGLVVQHRLRPQLAGGRVDAEVGSIVAAQAVGPPVVVGVRGDHRHADIPSRRRVLGYAARGAVPVVERRRLVGRGNHRPPPTADGFPAGDHRRHLVRIGDARGGVLESADILCDYRDGRAAVAVDGIGHVRRGRAPGDDIDGGPAQVHLRRRARRRQGRPGAELVAEFFPVRPWPVDVHLECRVLPRVEVPGIVVRAVVVQVHVPLCIDAAVPGRCLQLPGVPTLAAGAGRLPRCRRIPVAGGHGTGGTERPVAANQPAHIALARYGPRGVAGGDAAAAVAADAPDQTTDIALARHPARGVAGADARLVLSDQAAHVVAARHFDRGVAGNNGATVFRSHQPAHATARAGHRAGHVAADD